MKIITLNTWGGKVKEPLITFIKKYAASVDVFCFQEIYHQAYEERVGDIDGADADLFNELQKLLPEHVGYFCPTIENYYGIATFIKKNLEVKSHGDISIYDSTSGDYSGKGGNHSRKALWVDVTHSDKSLSILNVHGLWNGKGKTDTPERIEQSQRIRNFVDTVKGPQIVCGDFNLLPDTESLSILARGMQNLIKEYKVTSTRTSLYTRVSSSGAFADYVFLTPDIKVSEFKVMPEEVSDHAALFVDIKL